MTADQKLADAMSKLQVEYSYDQKYNAESARKIRMAADAVSRAAEDLMVERLDTKPI